MVYAGKFTSISISYYKYYPLPKYYPSLVRVGYVFQLSVIILINKCCILSGFSFIKITRIRSFFNMHLCLILTHMRANFVTLIFLQELMVVDHNRIYYRPFRKNFYVEVPEIAKLTTEGTFTTSVNVTLF